MATSATSGGKKPWRYYYVMAFPYSSAIPREKLLAMREATDTIERREEEYLHKIADRYALPEKKPPPSPVPGYIRALLQQIALGVMVLMIAALIAVYRVHVFDTEGHIAQDLVYAVVGCITAVFIVNALGWVALSWHSRAGVCSIAFFMVVLCVLSGFAIDQLVALQFTQRNLQEDLAENKRNFTEEDVGQLVNGGPAPSLLHRFILDGPTHFLRWLQGHCSFATHAQVTRGGGNSTSDGSAHTDQMIDSVEFYTGFWRPKEQHCVDSALSAYRKVETATQLALTALLVIMGVQLVLSGTLFLLEEAESVDAFDQVRLKGKRSRQKKKRDRKKGGKSRSQRRHQQQPYPPVLRLLSFAIAVSGLITCALSADLFVSCDFSIGSARYILMGIFGSGIAAITVGFLISCCHWERTNFIKWLLVLLAIANIYAVANCMTLQEVLRGEKSDAVLTKDVILQDAYELVNNQTCATVTTWRAHTCEHKKSSALPRKINNSSSLAVVAGDKAVDSVCQDELKSLLLATLRPGIAWLAGLVALNCLSLLILLAPAFQSLSSALARSFCNCLCFPDSVSSPSSGVTAAGGTSEKVQLKHTSLGLVDARELYLSTIRVKDEVDLEAETAAFNDEWARMTGCNAADITSTTIIYQNEFDAIVRSLVICRITTRCKMDVSLSVSKDGKQLFAKIHASDNLLMTALCDMEYTLELAEFVDPGPLFWHNKREIKNEVKVLDPHTIKQKLKLLAANNVITRKEAERFPSESLSRVSARIHALMRAARLSSGSLKCRNLHLPFAQYVPHTEFQYLFKKHPHQLEVPGNVRRSSVLRTIDCLRIARHLIEAELNVNQMVESGLLASFHGLHSASRFDFNSKVKLASSWVFFWRPRHLPGEFEPETHWFLNQFGRLNPFRQPLRDIRDYFGECIAFYFAWLAFYAQLLTLPASLVVVMALYQRDDPEFMISWNFYRTGHAPSTRFTISPVSFGVGLGVILWGILFAKFWERKSVWYQLEWGTTHLDLDLQDRTSFWGVMRRNPVTNEVEIYFNSRRRMLRQLGSMISILGLGAANLVVVVALILSQGYLAQWGLSLRLVVVLGSSCQAFLIQWNGDFISGIAHRLSEFENYQNDEAFQMSVVAKVFVLQLLNTYSGLFVLAFADLAWLEHTLLFGSLSKVYEKEIVPEMNVLVQLETMLLLIFLMRITSHLLAILHSYSMGKLALANLAHVQQQTTQSPSSTPDGTTTTNTSSVEDENALEPYRGSYEDYTEIVVQFGLVVMFSSVFPLAPLLAFIECVLEMRLDALDLCLFFQRPAPETAVDIGPWAACIQILLKLALATLFGLVYFTADNQSELSIVQRASAFLIATLSCWLLSEILWLVLPSTSTQAQEVQARNEFLVERYFGVDDNNGIAGGSGDEFGAGGAGGDFEGCKKAAELVATIEMSTVDDKEKAAQSKLEDDSSLEHYRERIELLRRLNVAMRRRDELLPTVQASADTVVASSSPPGEVPPVDDLLPEDREDRRIGIDGDKEVDEEEMIVGYFRPVRTPGAPASPSNAKQQQQQHSEHSQQPDVVPPTLSEDVALGIPFAQGVRESSASVSTIAPPPQTAAEAFSSDRRPSKRASFFARLSKRDSPRASFSSSSASSSRNRRNSSNSSEGLPPFSLASRRVSKLSPALMAAALELGVSDVAAPQPPRASVTAASLASPTVTAEVESQLAASSDTAAVSVAAPPPRLSISIPRQYTTKELAGMDAINEATQRSRFDFYAEDENQFKPKESNPKPQPETTKQRKRSFLSRMLSRSPSSASNTQPTPTTTEETRGLLPATSHSASHPRLELSGIEAVHAATRRSEFDFSGEDEM